MSRLEVKNLTKRYGAVCALEDVSFTLEPNKIYGLLGRNGAGKTTLLSILANRQFPTSGEAFYGGLRMTENDAVQRGTYCMSETMLYPESMRVNEVMRSAAQFYPRFDKDRCTSLMKRFELDGRKKIKSLSTGYATILKLIVALSCNAGLLLLDEPVLGLDANHREMFYDTLLKVYALGETTMLLSTHLIGEVADIVEDVLIIDRGRLLLIGNVEELKRYATFVTGGVDAVNAAIDGRKLLSTKTLGAEKTACVLGSFEAAPEGVTLKPLGLQQLFVQLTNSNTPEEDALYETDMGL